MLLRLAKEQPERRASHYSKPDPSTVWHQMQSLGPVLHGTCAYCTITGSCLGIKLEQKWLFSRDLWFPNPLTVSSDWTQKQMHGRNRNDVPELQGSGIASFCRLNHFMVHETSPGKSCCKIKERMIEGSPPACESPLLIKEWECWWVWFWLLW